MLPDRPGLDVLRELKARDPEVVVVVITAYSSVETAITAMREGAFHYISKPFKNQEVVLTVRKGLDQRRLQIENRSLRQRLSGLDNLIWRSPAMEHVIELVRRAAPSRSNVLLTGESGTGKELLARATHHLSPRAGGSFVVVNTGSVPTQPARVHALRAHTRRVYRCGCKSAWTIRGCRGWHDIPRRDWNDRPGYPGQASTRRPGARVHPVGGEQTSRSMCASSPRPMPTCRAWYPRARSAKTCTIVSTSSPLSFRPCANAVRTFRRSPTTSSAGSPRRTGGAGSRSRRRRLMCWSTINGRGTSASSRTSSSAPSSCARRSQSRPNSSRRRSWPPRRGGATAPARRARPQGSGQRVHSGTYRNLAGALRWCAEACGPDVACKPVDPQRDDSPPQVAARRRRIDGRRSADPASIRAGLAAFLAGEQLGGGFRVDRRGEQVALDRGHSGGQAGARVGVDARSPRRPRPSRGCCRA